MARSQERTLSLLDRLERLCNVDVDDVDTAIIASLPFTPHNQTSNQAVITNELLKPCNKQLLSELVAKYGNQGWEKVYDMAAVYFCARNLCCLKGRVMVQVSLRHAHDREAIIAHARSLSAAFEEAKVPRRRFAIKIPFTGAAASAALELNKEGIRSLATSVFSLEQAIAASQSNCYFISPYYNEIAAHLDPSVHPQCDNPMIDHPMSARIYQIVEAYKKAYKDTGKEQPVMVAASFLSIAEILAMPYLGCSHVTVQGPDLKLLMGTDDALWPALVEKPKPTYANWEPLPEVQSLSNVDRLAGPEWNGVKATMDTDYVANGGAKLTEFMNDDPIVSARFRDVEKFFLEAENRAKEAIQKLIDKSYN